MLKQTKIVKANNAGLKRLQAMQMLQSGKTVTDVAKFFKVDYSTIKNWEKMYKEGGVERLNAPLKPRPKHLLTVAEVKNGIQKADEKYHVRLNRLMRIAKGEQLKIIAESEGVSVQSIMKDRRLFEDGKLS